ncbi:MAG: NADH:flavin oxidoreductase [Deltaproteobacteria bacterium]|nr:NADH:flavin oxidoreductase [Deltaproteobacteria bacterium]
MIKQSLFDPIALDSLKCPNRVVLQPFQENMANRDGTVSQNLFNFYLNFAREGAGVIILESAYVATQGRATLNQLGICEESHTEGLYRLVRALKSEGAQVGLRLAHAGARTAEALCQEQPVGPSVINFGKDFDVSREFDDDDIEEITLFFVHAAERAEEVDADFIEINGTQQYLLDQCLSTRLNNRSDEYGGDIHQRMHLPANIIRAIKSRISPEMQVSYYFSIHDKLEDGFHEGDLKGMIKTLSDAKVDILHPVSIHVMNKFFDTDETLLEWVAKFTRLPVIAEGNIKSPQILKEAMGLNKAQLYALDRILFSRPNWYTFLQKKFTD